MFVEIVLILISIYFIATLWQYKKQRPEMFSETAIAKSMGTLLWLAVGLLLLVMIGITYLRIS